MIWEPRRTYTRDELIKGLNITEQKFKAWGIGGQPPGHRLGGAGHQKLYIGEEVLAWIKNQPNT